MIALAFVAAACLPVYTPPSQPVPQLYQVRVVLEDAEDQTPVAGEAFVKGEDSRVRTLPVRKGVDADGSAAWTLVGGGFEVCGTGPKHVEKCVAVSAETQTIRLVLDRVPEPPAPESPPQFVWPPPARDPLPPFPALSADGDGLWSFSDYAKELPFAPPVVPDRDFHRGNFSGIRVPECNLRLLQAGNGDPAHVMTWDLPQYSEDEQKCILNAYRARGYTHIVLSIPQARNWNVLERLATSLQLAKDHNQFTVLIVYGGDGETWDDVRPLLESYLALGLLDELNFAWQGDHRYDPWELVARTKVLGEWAHSKGLKTSQHWVNEALGWWNAADDPRRPNTCLDASELGLEPICNRFDYHRVMAPFVDYQYMQVDVNAPINDERPRQGGLQGAIRDVLRSLTTELLVVSEYDAQREFDDPTHATEAQGDLKGFLLMCTEYNGRGVLGGYMNGARLPSGAAF